MSRKIGITPRGYLYVGFADDGGSHVTDPTDAEVADLLARVLEKAGHELPEHDPRWQNAGPEYYVRAIAQEVVGWRAALARDAAAKEAEREGEEAATEWRLWLRHYTDALEVSWAARALAQAGVQVPVLADAAQGEVGEFAAKLGGERA